METKKKFYTIGVIIITLFVLVMLNFGVPIIKRNYYKNSDPFLIFKKDYFPKCYPGPLTLLGAYKLYISENGTNEAQNIRPIDLVQKGYVKKEFKCPGIFYEGILINYIIESTEPYKFSYNLINDTINIEIFCPLHKTTISDQININEIKITPVKSFFKYQ